MGHDLESVAVAVAWWPGGSRAGIRQRRALRMPCCVAAPLEEEFLQKDSQFDAALTAQMDVAARRHRATCPELGICTGQHATLMVMIEDLQCLLWAFQQ